MKLGKFTQAPADNKKYAFDYSSWLESSETVVSATAQVSPVTSPPMLVTGISTANAGKGLIFFCSGGIDGVLYRAAITATTSMPQVKEDYIDLQVKEPLNFTS